MNEEISIAEIAVILKINSKLIIIWTIFGLLSASLYSFFIVTPNYESSSRIVVNQTQNINQSLTNNDIQTNLNLINTYQSIILEPIILESVIENIDSNMTIRELKNKITIETQNNSLVFGISVTDESPYKAAEIANAIAYSFEENIGSILEVQSVTILSQAVANPSPISPNILLNLLLGTSLGLIIGVIISYMKEFMDKRVKDNKIIDEIGWTNLGSILEMSTEELKDTRMDKKIKINNTRTSSLQRRV